MIQLIKMKLIKCFSKSTNIGKSFKKGSKIVEIDLVFELFKQRYFMFTLSEKTRQIGVFPQKIID